MKISTLSLGASALLLLLAALLASLVLWSSEQRQEAELQSQTLQGLQQEFLVDIRANLDKYLASGDAGRLEQARAQLNDIHDRLPTDSQLAQELAQLVTALDGKYRAAGKLAGNPRQLLAHAETEMLDNNKRLADYGDQGLATAPQVAHEYLQLRSGASATGLPVVTADPGLPARTGAKTQALPRQHHNPVGRVA